MANTISEIIRILPSKLQNRFESLGNYVNGVIQEEEDKLQRSSNLTNEDIQFIQLAALVYLLRDFFRAGTRSARSAAITFQEFGVNGFQIGSTTFTRDNYDTRRGDILADNLQNLLLDTPLHSYITSANTMRELISNLMKELREANSDEEENLD